MATMLQNFRAKYPQYNDMDDETLAESLYQKHYTDLDPAAYRKMIGTPLPEPAKQPTIAERIDGFINAKDQEADPLAETDKSLTPLAKDLPVTDPIYPDWEDTTQTGFFSNTVRLAAERGSALLGHAISGIIGKPGEALEQQYPLGQIVFGTDWGPDDPADGSFRVRYMNGQELEQLQSQRDIENVFTRTVPDYLESADFGAEDRHTPETIKQQFAEGDVLGTAGEVLLFGVEQGIKSIPDMVAVMSGIPAIGAYVAARSDEIGDTRAVNKGLEESRFRENLEAVPFAIGSALLEKVGAAKVVGAFGKEAAKDIGQDVVEAGLKQAGKQIVKRTAAAAGTEAATEAFQEGVIEFLGERLGTDAPLDWQEATERGFFGALGGGVFGGVAGGTFATGAEITRALDNAAVETIERQTQASQRAAEGEPVLPTSVLSDPRIKRDVYRYNLAGMGQDLRTDIDIKPAWYQQAQTNPDLQMPVKQTQDAVQKALSGQPLGVRESRVIEFMLDQVTGQRVDPLNIDYARQQLEQARETRRQALPTIPVNPFAGELFAETDYLSDMDGETRIAYELTYELDVLGLNEQVDGILDSASNAMDAIKRLEILRDGQPTITPDTTITTIATGQIPTIEPTVAAVTTVTEPTVATVTDQQRRGLQPATIAAERRVEQPTVAAIVEQRNGERRIDVQRRERIATMSPDEMMDELYTSTLTGLHNRRAFNEEIEHANAVASIDADGLSGINDNLGHDAGDAMLKAVSEALKNTGVDAYHISGDEFYLLGDSEAQVSEAANQAQQALQQQVLEVSQGKVQGLGITTGVGTTKNEADARMESNKKTRQEQGLRSPKGMLPPGGVLYSSVLNIDAGNNYVPVIGQTGDLPLDQDNSYVLATTGKAVRIPDQPVRRKNIIDIIKRRFGVQIYQGRVRGKGRLGFYRRKFGEVRIKKRNDIEVTAHEIAHWMDERFPWIQKLYKLYPEEMQGVSYDTTKDFEGYAEFMRLWMTQDHLAREAAPGFYDAWMTTLDQHKGLRDTALEIQELMHAWHLQGARKRLQDRYGKQDVSIPERVRHIWDGFTDRILQKVFDGLRPFKEIEREIRGTVGSAATSGYLSLRLSYGLNGMMQALMNKGTFNWNEKGDLEFTGSGLKDIFDPVSDRMADMQSYMVARRAAELMQQGRENHIRADEIQAGLALGGQRVETIERVVDEQGEVIQEAGVEFIDDPALKGDPEFKDIFDQWLAFNERMFDFYESSGIVSPETRAAIEEMNKNYVPFNRIVETMQGEKPRARGKKLLPRLYGGTGNINDIFESIVGNTTHMVHAALINRGKANFYRMLNNSDGQTAALYAAPIGTDIKGVQVSSEQVIRHVVEAFGMDMASFRMAQTGLVASGQEADLVNTIEQLSENLEPMLTFFQFGIDPRGDNIDFYYEDGKKKFYEVADQGLLDAINHLGPKPHNMVVNMLGGFANVLRLGVTLTPTFQVKNFIRDTMNAFTLSKGHIVPAYGATKALTERIWNDVHYWEYMLNGGGFAAMADADGINQDRILDTKNKIMEALNSGLSAFEYSNRIAEFKKLREKGWTARDAVLAGREISTDFAMRGSSQTLRVLTISIPFLNARLQGLYRNGREIMQIEKGKARFAGQQAFSYALRSMAAITIPSLALYMLNKDDERYEEIPDWIRDLSWIIFTGDGEDDYVMIPKPFETGMLWGTLPERMMEAQYKDNKELADATLWMLTETFGLGGIPQAFKPWFDLQKNENFTGAPIVPEYMEALEPSEQYKSYTSDAMIALGRKLNISPLRAEYVVRGYLGTWGTWGLGLADFMVGDINNGGVEPTKGWQENFLLSPFVNEGPLKRTHSEDHLYNMLKETQKVANTVRLMVNRDPNRLEQYLDSPEKAAYYALNESLTGWAAQMRELNNTIEQVKIDPDLTGNEKRSQIFELQRAKNQISREVHKANNASAVQTMIDEIANTQRQAAP